MPTFLPFQDVAFQRVSTEHDGLLEKGKEGSLRGMPGKSICNASWTTNLRNMGFSGGASQVPAIALPPEEDARRDF
ncbi:MAG: hypothetical protein KJ653_10050, partial [Candidatus Thermoplasmatota archaeon]|nr:hypothetical protein [Candidatus Thermoplasmatota archaeon]